MKSNVWNFVLTIFAVLQATFWNTRYQVRKATFISEKYFSIEIPKI